MKWAGRWLAAAGSVLVASCSPETSQPVEPGVRPPAATAPPPDTAASTKFSCYFPESCYRLAEPAATSPTLRHRELAGRVLVEFRIDSLLHKHDFRIVCARLGWKKTGRQYAADCRHLTTTQQRELLPLLTSLLQSLRFVPYRPDQNGCGQEWWAMRVTFR